MENLYFSIPVLILCTAGFICSYKLQLREKYTLSLLVLMACGFLLRMYTASDGYLHPWDERYHALVAKNLTFHPLIPTLYDNPVLPADNFSWVGSHIWLHKQPLPLWAMSGSMCLFGFNEIALRLPSIILTTLGIWLTFSLATFFFNKKTGWLAAFFYAINGLIIEITAGRVATDHIDAFFLFFVSLSVYFAIKFVKSPHFGYNLLCGVALGAAILCKWLPALIVLPVWILLVKDSGRFRLQNAVFHFLLLCVTSIVVFLPWQLYIHHVFPAEAAWESGFNMKHITEVLEGQTGPFYYFLDKIRINYGELIYLPLAWFIWVSLKRPVNLKYLALLTWFGIPFLFFSAIMTKMQGYILFTAPVLFMITGEFWQRMNEFGKGQRHKWLFYVLLLALIALPVRYSLERMKPFSANERHPLWVQELKALGRVPVEKGILLNYSYPVEAMFYTSLTAYDYVPETRILQNLATRGYTLIINEGNNIDPEIRKLPGVVFFRFSEKN
jgi:4-amino-4-deoxy-L-arabinose transferase